MGYMWHDAVLVVSNDMDDAFKAAFLLWREKLPVEWQRLVIGPVMTVTNGYMNYAFLPDGSKEGWETSEDGDRYRQEFFALLAKHERWPQTLAISARFGGDEPDVIHVGANHNVDIVVHREEDE